MGYTALFLSIVGTLLMGTLLLFLASLPSLEVFAIMLGLAPFGVLQLVCVLVGISYLMSKREEPSVRLEVTQGSDMAKAA